LYSSQNPDRQEVRKNLSWTEAMLESGLIIAGDTLNGTAGSLMFMGGISKVAGSIQKTQYDKLIRSPRFSKGPLAPFAPQRAAVRSTAEAGFASKFVDVAGGGPSVPASFENLEAAKKWTQWWVRIVMIGVNAYDTMDINLAGVASSAKGLPRSVRAKGFKA